MLYLTSLKWSFHLSSHSTEMFLWRKQISNDTVISLTKNISHLFRVWWYGNVQIYEKTFIFALWLSLVVLRVASLEMSGQRAGKQRLMYLSFHRCCVTSITLLKM